MASAERSAVRYVLISIGTSSQRAACPRARGRWAQRQGVGCAITRLPNNDREVRAGGYLRVTRSRGAVAELRQDGIQIRPDTWLLRARVLARNLSPVHGGAVA